MLSCVSCYFLCVELFRVAGSSVSCTVWYSCTSGISDTRINLYQVGCCSFVCVQFESFLMS